MRSLRVTIQVQIHTLALRPNAKIAVAASKSGGRERHDQMPLDLAVLRFGGR